MVTFTLTRYRTVISACLLLTILAVVIHPIFDLPNSHLKRPAHDLHLSLPLIGHAPAQSPLMFGLTRTSFLITPAGPLSRTFLPLLC